MQNELSHLDWLESEAIHIMREVAGQCSNPRLALFRRKRFTMPFEDC